MSRQDEADKQSQWEEENLEDELYKTLDEMEGEDDDSNDKAFSD